MINALLSFRCFFNLIFDILALRGNVQDSWLIPRVEIVAAEKATSVFWMLVTGVGSRIVVCGCLKEIACLTRQKSKLSITD